MQTAIIHYLKEKAGGQLTIRVRVRSAAPGRVARTLPCAGSCARGPGCGSPKPPDATTGLSSAPPQSQRPAAKPAPVVSQLSGPDAQHIGFSRPHPGGPPGRGRGACSPPARLAGTRCGTSGYNTGPGRCSDPSCLVLQPEGRRSAAERTPPPRDSVKTAQRREEARPGREVGAAPRAGPRGAHRPGPWWVSRCRAPPQPWFAPSPSPRQVRGCRLGGQPCRRLLAGHLSHWCASPLRPAFGTTSTPRLVRPFTVYFLSAASMKHHGHPLGFIDCVPVQHDRDSRGE